MKPQRYESHSYSSCNGGTEEAPLPSCDRNESRNKDENQASPSDGCVQIKAFDTLLHAANSPTTQMVMPSDIQTLLGQTLEVVRKRL